MVLKILFSFSFPLFLGFEGDGFNGGFNLTSCGDRACWAMDSLCIQLVSHGCLFCGFDLSFSGEDHGWSFGNFWIFFICLFAFFFFFCFAFYLYFLLF